MPANPDLAAMVFAIAAVLMLLEFGWSRLAGHHDSHDLKETRASLLVFLGQVLLAPLRAGLFAIPFAFAWEMRLFEVPMVSVADWICAILAVEFVYYWQHRLSHGIRWFWATHCVHHSATRLNFTAAIRLGWTGGLSGLPLFYLPLVLLGWHPAVVFGLVGINLLWQFVLHTETLGRFGPLEWILNTPTHHRVHHACNAACLDRNFGGLLIIYDRIFGTFAEAPRDETLVYGLGPQAPVSHNPVRIALGEWFAMARDVRAAAGWKGRLRALVRAP